MLSVVTFSVPGEPVAKARLRHRLQHTRDGREFIQGYTPADSRAYERSVAFEARSAMRGRKPAAGPLVLVVEAFFPVPVSWPKWQQREARLGVIVPTGRPDWDNIGKICSDAMNRIVYTDDATIVDALVRKRFSGAPRIDIAVHVFNPLGELVPQFAEILGSEA